MDERLLIELLEDLTGSQNDDGRKWDILLERCLNASESDLDEFLDDLSRFFDIYLPTLQIFIFYHCNKYLQAASIPNLTRWNTSLDKFASILITKVIMKNLHNSDMSGFGVFLYSCIELLWLSYKSNNKDNNKPKLTFQIMKCIFSEILDKVGVFGTLVSGAYGHICFKRILFDFNIINCIEWEELL